MAGSGKSGAIQESQGEKKMNLEKKQFIQAACHFFGAGVFLSSILVNSDWLGILGVISITVGIVTQFYINEDLK